MTTETLWLECLKIMREEVGSRVVETWFKAIKCVHWDSLNKKLYLQAPNKFVQDWVSKNYETVCNKNCARLLNEQAVHIVFTDGEKNTKSSSENDHESVKQESLYTPAKQLMPKVSLEASTALVSSPSFSSLVKSRERFKQNKSYGLLNENYVFSNFIVGPSNNLAFSAAQVVAEHVGYLYNPLFIYGDSGLGKTHLLHAIGNAIRERDKKTAVLYQPAERFVHDFISAIRTNKVYHFEARYKDIDVLLIDDVQFISNKEQTQEAFFHIFNMLHQKHKQIVFTSDSMPRDIAGLAQRMRSRLEGGLLADIQLPALETRIAILQKKGEAFGQQLPYDVAHFIALRGSSNVRELEGMLLRVIASAALAQEPISCEVAQKVLFGNQPVKNSESLSLQHVAAIVGKNYGYSLQDLRSNNRNKDLAHARHVAFYCMKRLTPFSLREISKFLERKDHSTVMYAFEKMKQRIECDIDFANEIRAIENRCSG